MRDVSFSVAAGQKVAIVGESGSGKSALALAIIGLLKPPGQITGGEVLLNGRDLRCLSRRQLGRVLGKEIALVHQDPLTALDPIRTIGAQLAETLRVHDRGLGRAAIEARTVELLEQVEIPHARRRLRDHPHQFSGGMRQRVVIAMALANSPSVVIADEPTTALDVTTQAQILDLLDRLVAEHDTSVVLITHDLGIVADFSDEVLVMYAGRIVEQARTDELLTAPAHPYASALIRAVPRQNVESARRLESIPGAPPDLAVVSPGCAFEPRCAVGSGNRLCVGAAPPWADLPSSAGHHAACHFARREGSVSAEHA